MSASFHLICICAPDLSAEVVIRNHYLLIYFALDKVPRSIPTSFNNWPTGSFIGVDTSFLLFARNLVSEVLELAQDSFSLFGILRGETHITIGPLSEIKIKGDALGTVVSS